MCKVQWSHHTKEEATWEREEELKAFQVSFPICPNLGDEIHFKGGRFVTPRFSKRIEFYKVIYLNK
jgi:hypothetical protein